MSTNVYTYVKLNKTINECGSLITTLEIQVSYFNAMTTKYQPTKTDKARNKLKAYQGKTLTNVTKERASLRCKKQKVWRLCTYLFSIWCVLSIHGKCSSSYFQQHEQRDRVTYVSLRWKQSKKLRGWSPQSITFDFARQPVKKSSITKITKIASFVKNSPRDFLPYAFSTGFVLNSYCKDYNFTVAWWTKSAHMIPLNSDVFAISSLLYGSIPVLLSELGLYSITSNRFLFIRIAPKDTGKQPKSQGTF